VTRSRFAHIVGYSFAIMVLVIILLFSLFYKKNYEGIPGRDKLGHFMAYMALGFSSAWGFAFIPKRGLALKRNLLVFVLCFLFCFLIGFLIEILQPFFGRTYDTADLKADVIGIFLGLLLGFCSIIVTVLAFRRFIKPRFSNKV